MSRSRWPVGSGAFGALLVLAGCASDSSYADRRYEARKYVVSGRVTDQGGKPLENVVVFHTCTFDGKEHRSDFGLSGKDGRYEATIPRDERGDLVADERRGAEGGPLYHPVPILLFEREGFRTEQVGALQVPATVVLERP